MAMKKSFSLSWTDHLKAAAVGLIFFMVTHNQVGILARVVGGLAMIVAAELMFDWDKRSYQDLQARLKAAQSELVRLSVANAHAEGEMAAMESLLDETLMALVLARESIPPEWGESWMSYLDPYLRTWSKYRNNPSTAPS